MADPTEEEDEATIIKADYTLMRKFGGASLDKVFSSEAIQEAQKTIAAVSDDFYRECVEDGKKLQSLVTSLKANASAATLQNIADTAFSAKVKAGQGGFELIAALAKSLQDVCEKTPAAELTPAAIQIVEWHVQSIGRLLSLKIAGDGGEAGKAILEEIEKLNR